MNNKNNNSYKKDKKKKDNETMSLAAENMLENNFFKLQEMIEGSYKNSIKKSDRDQYRQYTPRMLWGNPCKFFPTTPLSVYQSNIRKKKINKLLVFHGTYQQHLAAKELKKKSWKYHKKYTTWLLPDFNTIKILNEQVEHGTYVSFDYVSTWSKQLKKNFSFEYIHLEDEITI
ncbi:hypothetical protein PFMG_00665 [Plasmodium falciparum IGH-CR14]|uniref:NOT2/NOT3/NOT5 C-terminal domain-containing protein n=1 Tax=Plasmodium falciparum IGH-CR14 TaxID=580059 RepID=A0A0L1I4J2_PLAFA|nr:hypothetical protein PFMG_00665 [Plasmodium falciparum IGH-CR14]